MRSWESSFDDKQKDLLEVIGEFLNTLNINDACQILEQNPELLSEKVDSILDTLSDRYVQSEEIIELIRIHRDLLAFCREMGIAKVFEMVSGSSNNQSGDDLKMILKEIIELSKPQDMPRKIILLQHALSLVQYQSNLELWAYLQVELGISLYQNPQSNQGDNIEKAIEHYNQALNVYTLQNFSVQWAMTQNNLANAYWRRIRGTRADNIEIAITHYNQGLQVRTQNDFPKEWANTQNNLANAYWNRIRGERADNIEKAIEHYNQALEVYTYQDFPVEWATLQNNLANAYCSRIREDLAENIEKAIKYYNLALKVRTQKNFSVEWAMIQNNLANAYGDRILGDRAENIERAIEYYNQAFEVYTYQEFAVEWAGVQNNLAATYTNRIRGVRVENIEKAIEHYNLALKVRTHQDFSMDWAETQNNLGNAYCDRILGDRAENIERAIEHYNQAFEVYTYQEFPLEWANTQTDIAAANNNRIRGSRSNNIEQAIEHCNQALRVYTPQNLPVKWAMTQIQLANAYCNRICGDRAENIEKAIEHYNRALEIYTLHIFPAELAGTQSNLAAAYNIRIRGNRTDNCEKSIKYYIQSLEVYTYQKFPMEWARSQNNLAAAYTNSSLGDKAENIEKAIEHYNQALNVYTLQNFPVEWATTQHNLGNAYNLRIQGDKVNNFEQAILHYNKALKVRTKQDFPVDWALTQSNLAVAYNNRILGDRAENIERALSHCHNALQIYKLESMPNDLRRTCKFLGDLYLDTDQWKYAMESYNKAIKAGDLLYRSGLSTDSKTVELEENAHFYRSASLAACHLGLITEAIVILEGGKTRLLNEALRLKIKQPDDVPDEEWIKYKQASENYRVSINLTNHEENYIQKEKRVQNALEELDTTVTAIQRYNPEFQRELNVSDILSALDKETALLTFCITDKDSIGFVVSKSNGIQSVNISDFKTKDLNNLLFKPTGQELIIGGWVGDYLSYCDASNVFNHYINEYNKKGIEIEKQLFEADKRLKDAFQTWQKTLNNVLSSVGATLLNPLLAELPPQIKRLILLPSGGLFILPLHAVPLSDGQLLCQRFCISYAPSIQLLREMQNKAVTAKGEGLYAVINPQEDPSLVFSGFEGQTISELFESRQVNVGETGTKATVLDRISGKAYLHFSCHGSYNWNDPLQSGLHLVGGRILSLADLQNDIVDISSARLVTLSACETGITDIVKGSADEFVGLPAGFMLAGVPCVVGSLWSVPEISTAILMERFYSNHIVGGMDIPLALQDAQLWVRDLTSKQVADYVEKRYLSGKWEGKSKKFIKQYRERCREMAKKSPDKRPFQHPYYWAAFTVNGT